MPERMSLDSEQDKQMKINNNEPEEKTSKGLDIGGKQKKENKEMIAEEIREKLRDPSFLPSRKQIMKAFLGEWNKYDEFCYNEKSPVFEVFNEEYLNAFADYFVQKIKEYGASRENPLLILELEAGNGRLSHFLQQKLDEKAQGKTKVIATGFIDYLNRGNLKADFPVEEIDKYKVFEKYHPDIVVVSWMEYGNDLTSLIRQCKSVKEYILIGETDSGCCGHQWWTWGYQSREEKEKDREKRSLFEEEGFERKNLDELSKLQICRLDATYHSEQDSDRFYHSKTVSFKRKKE